jgi:hypothetical protein
MPLPRRDHWQIRVIEYEHATARQQLLHHHVPPLDRDASMPHRAGLVGVLLATGEAEASRVAVLFTLATLGFNQRDGGYFNAIDKTCKST